MPWYSYNVDLHQESHTESQKKLSKILPGIENIQPSTMSKINSLPSLSF